MTLSKRLATLRNIQESNSFDVKLHGHLTPNIEPFKSTHLAASKFSSVVSPSPEYSP